MKKKISLLGLVLILVFGFTGCSKSDATEYNQAELEAYADFILQQFVQMDDEMVQQYKDLSDLQLDLSLMSTGVQVGNEVKQLPVSGENFLIMIDAWVAGEEECGAFVSRDSYTMTTTNDSATLTADVVFENNEGTIEFVFDEKGDMESLTVAAQYSTGEILQKAALNTIICMGTVFVVLIFISFIIYLLKWIPVLEKKFRKKPLKETETTGGNSPAPDTAAPAAEEEDTNNMDDTELAAVIAAAVAAAEGTSPDGLIVRSIKRRRSNKWN